MSRVSPFDAATEAALARLRERQTGEHRYGQDREHRAVAKAAGQTPKGRAQGQAQAAVAPDRQARAKDERLLAYLNCWDASWSVADIADAFGATPGVVIGLVHRIHDADPDALQRKPQRRKAA